MSYKDNARHVGTGEHDGHRDFTHVALSRRRLLLSQFTDLEQSGRRVDLEGRKLTGARGGIGFSELAELEPLITHLHLVVTLRNDCKATCNDHDARVRQRHTVATGTLCTEVLAEAIALVQLHRSRDWIAAVIDSGCDLSPERALQKTPFELSSHQAAELGGVRDHVLTAN